MNKINLTLLILLIVLVLFGCVTKQSNFEPENSSQLNKTQDSGQTGLQSQDQQSKTVNGIQDSESEIQNNTQDTKLNTENTTLPSTQPNWEYGGVAISGKYADADIVYIGNGKYRLYYSEEPEAEGFKGRVYSATSIDVINCVVE